MKFMRIVLAIAIVAILAQCSGSSKKAAIKTDLDSLSYCIGYLNAKDFKERLKIDSINIKALVLAMEDYTAKKKGIMEPMQMNMFIQRYLAKVQSREQVVYLKESKAFLEKNKNEKGVVITPSGLQYIVLIDGKGPTPKPYDSVTIKYHVSLMNGTTLDSTGERAVTFPCQMGIKGWSEALQMMNAGSKWKLFLAPELAYGANPPPRSPIKPNSVLIFEVELIKITAGIDPSKATVSKSVPKKK
jgi:FKBP-type peptidyl-prolyl cis-trans isomerase